MRASLAKSPKLVALLLVSVVVLLSAAAAVLVLSGDDEIDSPEQAFDVLRESGDPQNVMDAAGYLRRANREDATVASRVAEFARTSDSPDARSECIVALAGMWEDGDDNALRELKSFLQDEDLAFITSINLAQQGDTSGADVLRAVAVSDREPNPSEQTLSDAQEARWWLDELGLE